MDSPTPCPDLPQKSAQLPSDSVQIGCEPGPLKQQVEAGECREGGETWQRGSRREPGSTGLRSLGTQFRFLFKCSEKSLEVFEQRSDINGFKFLKVILEVVKRVDGGYKRENRKTT